MFHFQVQIKLFLKLRFFSSQKNRILETNETMHYITFELDILVVIFLDIRFSVLRHLVIRRIILFIVTILFSLGTKIKSTENMFG